jgi:hypothetical protein
VNITKWDAGTWIALGAAVFAGAAALAAWWQARAARDQVAIMQQQLDNETDARREDAGPIFTITDSTTGSTPQSIPFARFTVMPQVVYLSDVMTVSPVYLPVPVYRLWFT